MKSYTLNTYVGDDNATVTFDYAPGQPGVHTLPNGDPGFPDEDDELDITSVVINGEEATLTPEQCDELQQRVIDYIEERIASEVTDYYSQRARCEE